MKRIVLLLACIAFAGAASAQEESTPAPPSLRIGGDIRVTEAAVGPLRAVGGNVTVDAPVSGKVQIAGGNVKLGSGAAVSGDVAIAGGEVIIQGAINGKLRAAGGNIRIDGPVTGNASIAGGRLELGPNARIEGKLRFFGGELIRDPAAQVVGGVEQERGRSSGRHEMTATQRFLHGWVWSVGLVALAALIAAAFPGASQRMALELRERPWITPLLGILALVTIPVAAVLVIITIVGIPIGLAALIGYVLLLLLGYVWTAVVIGGMLLDRIKPEVAAQTAWHAGAAALAMLALAILVRVPYFGGLLKLTAVALGVGMIVAAVMRLSQPAPSTATPA
jgi:hypothetical protein